MRSYLGSRFLRMCVASFRSASLMSLARWGKRLTVADENWSPQRYDLIPNRVDLKMSYLRAAEYNMIKTNLARKTRSSEFNIALVWYNNHNNTVWQDNTTRLIVIVNINVELTTF